MRELCGTSSEIHQRKLRSHSNTPGRQMRRRIDSLDRQLPAVSNDDGFRRASTLRSDGFNFLDHVHALHDLSEHDVLAVQPASGHGAEKELGSIRPRASVRHGQHAGAIMPQLEILVLELHSIDRLPACSVASGEISALTHETRNDTVKAAPLEMQRFPRLSDALLSSTESAKILRGLRSDVLPELHHNAPRWGGTEVDVKENSRIRSADDPGQKQRHGAHKR